MRVVLCALTLCSLALGPGCAEPASRLPALSSTQRGPKTDIAVGAVNGVPIQYGSVVSGVGRGTSVAITGWAVDSSNRSAASGVLALVDGRIPVEAMYGGATPQIATMLHTDRYGTAGYDINIPTANLALGLHRISFYVLARDRKEYYPTDRIVNILVVPRSAPRSMVIGDHHHMVGSLDQVTTVDLASTNVSGAGPVWLQQTATLFLRGWAVDVIHRREITHYDLSIDGQRAIVHPGDLRPELATTFPNMPKIVASYAGFTAISFLARFPTGVHQLTLTAVDPATGERVPLVRHFAFATYAPKKLAALVEPNWGPARPIRFGGGGLDGSIDLITTLARADDLSRQSLPVYADRSDYLFIRGWGLDVRHHRTLPPTYAIIDGRRRFAVNLREPRPDIVSEFPMLPNAIGTYSGFSVAIPMRRFAMGPHHVTLETQDTRSHAEAALVANFPFTVL